MKTGAEQPIVENPFYFEVRVRCLEQIALAWELHDDSGKLLDKDPRGELAFLVNKASPSERTLGVRDFALSPSKTSGGKLVLHATTYSIQGEHRALPELSIPLHLDLKTTAVSYAVPANKEFGQAVIDSVESIPPHRIPMQAKVDWRTTTLLHVQPAMLGGAAAEAAARAYGTWHVVKYEMIGGTAHLTTLGGAWAGVTYYLTGLQYLLEKTVERQPGVQRVVTEKPPEFGN